MTHVIVTHAPEDGALAEFIADKLDALGFEVRQDADIRRALSPFERRRLKAEIDRAARVIVLWSRGTAEAPALRLAAEQARAAGKLTVARIDAAAPPAGLAAPGSANLANWSGRDGARAWRQILAEVGAANRAGAKPATAARAAAPARAASAPVEASPAAKKGGAGLAIVLIFALIAAAGAGYYFFMM